VELVNFLVNIKTLLMYQQNSKIHMHLVFHSKNANMQSQRRKTEKIKLGISSMNHENLFPLA